MIDLASITKNIRIESGFTNDYFLSELAILRKNATTNYIDFQNSLERL
jgi:hypothetical protein